MNNILYLFIALSAGFALGSFYFGGLWWTVRQLPTTKQPIRLFLGSFIFRLLLTLLGFYVVMNGQWERALAGLGGFLLARILLVRRWQPKPWQ